MTAHSAPRPASRRWLRLSEYGWGRKALLILAALVGSAAFAYAANLAARNALWQVVRVCMVDQTSTGSPRPCLEVDLSHGADNGFAVLRPPVGAPDTILTPTRRIVGLEDPRLAADDIPNYFALAWNARRWLTPAPAQDRLALAVNSRLARSQDQLHVHLGCMTQSFAATLRAGALGPRAGQWFRGPDMAPGLELWTYRGGDKDWRALDPIRLARNLVGGAGELRRTTLAVVQTPTEFVVAMLKSRPGGWYASADDVIDVRC
ncbi:MAG: CDP-diacylglycerol diphosphatase [Pseudomonadota bacterium]|nr:CDP-diacylglycerol diphosphatase [Pseudomonadota bacterium]